MIAVLGPETISMTTRDGVRLDADVYRPATGDHPVLLMRQPYGRQIASTVCYAHPSWYAAQGYVVVIQDVRGRGTSQGVFDLFVNEAEDGAQTIEWAAALPGSNGRVGMYGFSYQGSAQMLTAARRVSALKAIAPAMIGWEMRSDWAYENDAFCLAANLSWGLQIAAESARLAADEEAFHALFAASRATPFHNATPARPYVLTKYAHYAPHYGDWLDQAAEATYWADISPKSHVDILTGDGPPALFIGGWYDSHLPGTIAAYRAYEAARSDSRLIVGPWAHFPWGRSLGEEDFGEAATGEIDLLQVRWFDRWLKDAQPDEASAPVTLFDMGDKVWRTLSAWPDDAKAAQPVSWSLSGGGRVALDPRDGVLTPAPPAASGADHIVHDPWRPVQSVGGAFASPAGPVDRTTIDARPDVLTYTSGPLEADVAVAGTSEAWLSLSSDSVSIDVSCILSRVGIDGRSVHLTEGYRHFPETPGGDTVCVPLRPTCTTLKRGERLRLSIAGASFPNHPVNPGTGQRPVDARLGDHRIITLTVHSGGEHPSTLRLSVVPNEQQA